MTIVESLILAIVEGLTEFLPVSSTGHMILTQALMKMQSTEYLSAFTVMIQLGAILSVIVLYLRRFLPTAEANARPDGLGGYKLYKMMVIGSIPAVVLGVLLEDQIDALLRSVWVVVLMLFVGGVVMIVLDRRMGKREQGVVTPRRAFLIGLYQCLAMIPGTSRSMVTIFGGMQQGLTRQQAAEYSFFLAVPIMAGATALKAYKLYKEFGLTVFEENWHTLLTGNVVAFLVALVAIKGFIGIVSRYGFVAFGYYRIALAAVFALLMLLGLPLSL